MSTSHKKYVIFNNNPLLLDGNNTSARKNFPYYSKKALKYIRKYGLIDN